MTPTTLSQHQVHALLHRSQVENYVVLAVVLVMVVAAILLLSFKLEKDREGDRTWTQKQSRQSLR